MHLLQKLEFERVYRSLHGNIYVLVHRHPVSGHWILSFTDSGGNYWFLAAQRGGLRQFRSLDTLQKFVSDTLRADFFQLHDDYPDRFPSSFLGEN